MGNKVHAGLTRNWLEDLVRNIGYPPQDASVVEDTNELPLALRRLIRGSRARGTQCLAWCNETQIWIAEGLNLSGPGAVALLVAFYNNNGVKEAAGIWTRDSVSSWRLVDILETTFPLPQRASKIELAKLAQLESPADWHDQIGVLLSKEAR